MATKNIFLNNIQSKIFVTPEEFTGTDFERINQAVNHPTIDYVVMNGDYVISHPIDVPSNKIIEINGSVKIQDGITTTLTQDVSIGDTIIKVSDASGFKVAQQIGIYDNNSNIQGGSTGQTRKEAFTSRILSINGNDIEIELGMSFNYELSTSVIGHLQSCFVVQNDDVHFRGFGVVDANKSNQIDAEARGSSVTDAMEYGNGITFINCNRVSIEELTIENAPIININLKYVVNWSVNNIHSLNAHDKNFLAWYSSEFSITNSEFKFSDYEDGICFHNDVNNGFIDNIYFEDCSRSGLNISTNCHNIRTGNNIIAKNCGGSLSISGANDIDVTIQSIGGGKYRHRTTSANSALVSVKNTTHSDIKIKVSDSTLARWGCVVLGDCDELNIEPTIENLISSSSDGIGLLIGDTGGFSPKNIRILNPNITNNKKGISIGGASKKIDIFNGKIIENTLNIENGVGEEVKFFKIEGTNVNDIKGKLVIEEDSTGGVAAGIEQIAYKGQPSIKTSRYEGSKTLPETIRSKSGLFRFQTGGFNGVNQRVQTWLSCIATEDWTSSSNGMNIILRATAKDGGNSTGNTMILTDNGVVVGARNAASFPDYQIESSPASFLARFYPIYDVDLFQGQLEDGTTVFKVDKVGNLLAQKSQFTELKISSSNASNTTKVAKFLSGRYKDDGDFLILYAASNSSVNSLDFGGGTGSNNAATQVRFFAAQTKETSSTVSRMTILHNKIESFVDFHSPKVVVTGKTSSDILLGDGSTVNAKDLDFSGLPVFSDDSTAGVGGVVSGKMYMTATGELRIKL